MKNAFEQEQLVRLVTSIGNGAHIFAPKEWLGEEVIIIRKAERKSLKQKILDVLNGHLENILGVYLYGSQARGEADKSSDIDLLVVTTRKTSIKKKGFEIICLKKDEIDSAIKASPIMMHAILAEAKPIINEELLNEMKDKYIIDKKSIEKYVHNTKEVLQKNIELLELDEKSDGIASDAVIYSLILRLRGIFIIESILSGRNYSKNLFENWLVKEGVTRTICRELHKIYRVVKGGKKIKTSIKVKEARKLIDIVEEEIVSLHGKEKKEA